MSTGERYEVKSETMRQVWRDRLWQTDTACIRPGMQWMETMGGGGGDDDVRNSQHSLDNDHMPGAMLDSERGFIY